MDSSALAFLTAQTLQVKRKEVQEEAGRAPAAWCCWGLACRQGEEEEEEVPVPGVRCLGVA